MKENIFFWVVNTSIYCSSSLTSLTSIFVIFKCMQSLSLHFTFLGEYKETSRKSPSKRIRQQSSVHLILKISSYFHGKRQHKNVNIQTNTNYFYLLLIKNSGKQRQRDVFLYT